jgi:hypothetical protein
VFLNAIPTSHVSCHLSFVLFATTILILSIRRSAAEKEGSSHRNDIMMLDAT